MAEATRFQRAVESAARGLALLRRNGRSPATHVNRLAIELLSERGEASEDVLAAALIAAYRQLAPSDREAFLLTLLEAPFPSDSTAVRGAAERYLRDGDAAALAGLVRATEPPRQELFRRLNAARGGTAALVAMREDVLGLLPRRRELAPVDADLHSLLSSWFNRGFLQLQRIDWRTAALVLEKLIQHESVHEIRGWADLRRRLEDDRRCYAFFHPALPDEPLIFVEVALTQGMPAAIQPLLDLAGPRLDVRTANTATFYSINNCLPGLRGISFGAFLIKRVVAELRAERVPVRRFATLSPIPGFRDWLAAVQPETLVPADGSHRAITWQDVNDPSWPQNGEVSRRLKPTLIKYCAEYLLQGRSKNRTLDPVAAFHLRNGAEIERINWLADPSPTGMTRAFGLMVNYVYRLGEIEENHEAFVRTGQITASSEIRSLVKLRA